MLIMIDQVQKLRVILTKTCLLVVLLCASCAAREPANEDGASQIRDYILIELALRRNQDKQAYEIIEQLTDSGLSNQNYAHLVSLLNKRKHDVYRYQLIQRWNDNYPQSSDALLALAKEDICNGNEQQVSSASDAFKNIDEINVLRATMACLNVGAQLQLVNELQAQDANNRTINQLSCHLLARSSQTAEAISCFARISPLSDIRDLSALAELYLMTEQLPLAQQTYEQLLALEPNDVQSRYELASIYYDQGNFTLAITQLESLLLLSPKNRNAQYLLAASYYAERELDKSRIWFEKILVYQPLRNLAFYYLGMIAMESGNTEQAMEFLSSVKPSEEYLPAQLNYWKLVAQDDLMVAINGLYDLLDEQPESRMAIKLAQIDLYNNAGEKLKATQELVSLADDFPTHLRLQVLRMQWLIDQEYVDRIMANLEASLSGLINNTQKRQLITSTLYHLMEQEYGQQAVTLVEAQTIILPDTEQYTLLHSLAHAMAGNFATATEQLHQLLEQNPERHDIQNALGYTYVLEGKQLAAAEKLLNQALDANPDSAAYLDSMGWLRFKQGDLSAAEALLTRANAYTNEPTIKAHLIEVYQAQNRHEEARQMLNEALESFPDSVPLKALQLDATNLLKSAND